MKFMIGDYVLLHDHIHTRVTEASVDANGDGIYQTEDTGFEWVSERCLSKDVDKSGSDFAFDGREIYAVLITDSHEPNIECKLFKDYGTAYDYLREQFQNELENEIMLAHNVRTEFMPVDGLFATAKIRCQANEFYKWETITFQIVQPEIILK